MASELLVRSGSFLLLVGQQGGLPPLHHGVLPLRRRGEGQGELQGRETQLNHWSHGARSETGGGREEQDGRMQKVMSGCKKRAER